MAQPIIDPEHQGHKMQGIASINMILELIANKWTVMILAALSGTPLRFNELKRQLGQNITHKALVESLRRLERSGLLKRHVITTPSISVEYSLSALANTLDEPFRAMQDWVDRYSAEVLKAQQLFDSQSADGSS